MELTKGMTAEEMTAMVETQGWEVVDDHEYEAFDGSVARQVTLWQGDHGVAVDLIHGVVEFLEFIPDWAM